MVGGDVSVTDALGCATGVGRLEVVAEEMGVALATDSDAEPAGVGVGVCVPALGSGGVEAQPRTMSAAAAAARSARGKATLRTGRTPITTEVCHFVASSLRSSVAQ